MMHRHAVSTLLVLAAAAPALAIPDAAAAAAATPWDTGDQNRVASPSAVSVSPDSKWAVYTVSQVAGSHGSYSPGGELVLTKLGATAGSSPVAVWCGSACSDPQFAADGSLALLKGGALYRSAYSSGGVFSAPALVVNDTVLAYSVAPDSKSVAYTVARMGNYSATEARVVTDDVIINVITGTPQPLRNVLCVAAFGAADGAPRCFDQLEGSVGMEGWRISCWPYDSQFSWAPDSKTVAMTRTAARLANDWETVRMVTVDVTKTAPTVVKTFAPITFQPMYSKSGALAFTQADSLGTPSNAQAEYTWAQTWKICVQAPGGDALPACDEVGTSDAMPTLVGWTDDDAGILYMEQAKTGVNLYLMAVSAGGKPGKWSKVSGIGSEQQPSVIGGGFRATSRATISASGVLGFSHEDAHTAPQAFAAKLRGGAASALTQLSHLNANAAAQKWPAVTTRTWRSNDGGAVEGLLIHAASTVENQRPGAAPPPLIVFTHCGPAMASLSTFIGAGSVCARFPLEIWAMRGYNVLLPNYRGSTGYGRTFRRADLNGWGAGDYDDVMTGFTSMATAGLATLDNAAHVGWSYGGYTSALALTKAKATHGVGLKAVVGGGCLTDLISQIGTTDISKIYQSSNSGQYYWVRDASCASLLTSSLTLLPSFLLTCSSPRRRTRRRCRRTSWSGRRCTTWPTRPRRRCCSTGSTTRACPSRSRSSCTTHCRRGRSPAGSSSSPAPGISPLTPIRSAACGTRAWRGLRSTCR